MNSTSRVWIVADFEVCPNLGTQAEGPRARLPIGMVQNEIALPEL